MFQIMITLVFMILLAYHGFLGLNMVRRQVVSTIQKLHTTIVQLTQSSETVLTPRQENVAEHLSQTSITRVNRVYRYLNYNLYGIVDILAVVLFVLGQGLLQYWLIYLSMVLLIIGCVTLTYCLLIQTALAKYWKAMKAHL